MYRGGVRHRSLISFKCSSTHLLQAMSVISCTVVLNLFLIFNPLYSYAATETQEEKPQNAEALIYHELDNETLLQQTQSLYHDTSNTFLAHMRGLSNNELLLEDARTESDQFQIPPMPVLATDKTKPLESSKLKVKHVKERLDAYQQQLELIQAEQTLLENHIDLIKKAEIETKVFEDTIDSLKLPLYEISLRIQDGTISEDKVPKHLQDYNLEALREQIQTTKDDLKQALDASNTEKEVNTKRIEESKKVINTINALHESTQSHYAQELKRQELMKEYVDQEPGAILTQLAQLEDELIGLNGSLQISQRRFGQAQAEVEQLQAKLEALKKPEKPLPSLGTAMGAEEAAQVTQQADAIVAYHSDRVELLKQLEQGLDKLIRTGEALNGDAVVFNDHLFRMRLPAEMVHGWVKDGTLPADQVSEEYRLDALQQPSTDYATTSSTAVAQAKERRGQIAQEMEQSQTARTEVRDQLEHLQKMIALAKQAQQWEQELKDLTAEQVAERFQDMAQQSRAAEPKLQTSQDIFEKAKATVAQEQEQFDSLTDPLLRLAKQEFVAEKSKITKKLYGFAELELPAELKEQADDTVSPSDVQSGGASTQETEQYQNLLATRSRILDERDKQKEVLKEKLTTFDQRIQAYLKLLNEADQRLQQQYANAVELKKRIGRQQLQGDAIPDGITEALNRERIEQIEAQIADLASEHVDVTQEIEDLSQADENFEKLHTAFTDTLTAVGKRVDLLKDEDALKREYERTRQDLSEVEQTSLAQAAARRTEASENREEAVLAFVPSAAADGVSETLKVFYQELIELEGKQANLAKQKQLTERIIELAEAEKASIGELLPLLQAQAKLEANAEEATWVRIQAQLMPQKAGELLSAYEAKTGEHIALPPPIPEDERVAAIEQETEVLFERHTVVLATQKWLDLFEQRLSVSGLDGEIGQYQDQVGAINAQNAANQRRMYQLSGYPSEVLAEFTPEERPKTAADRTHLLLGEIGSLRRDRSDLRRQAVIDILIRIAIILVAALILAWIVGMIINRMSRRSRAVTSDGSAQTQLVLSFLKTTLRSAIWVTAVVLILSTLGFNIGAILAGLGIGGLAVAMAARETLADIIGGIMIFTERPFVIGDTIQVASGPVAKVVDMNWRTTKLLGTTTYYYNMPNSQVANSTIQNFTRDKPICDWVTLYVSAEHAPEEVIAVSNRAIHECDRVVHEDGMIDTALGGAVEMGQQTAMIYWPWWYIDDYHSRGGIRHDVWLLLWKHFQEAGIKLEIKPFDLPEDERPPVGLIAQSDPTG